MTSYRVKYKSDNLIELNGTVDEINQTAIIAGVGISCICTIYDDLKDAKTTADASVSDTIIFVSDARHFVIDDFASIESDDGTFEATQITGKDINLKTITVGALAKTAAKGAMVSVALGGPITMIEYGTPVIGKYDWGWRGLIQDTHIGLEIGQKLRIEIKLIGGADLTLVENVSAFVDGGT